MDTPININRWQNKVRALLGMRGVNPVPTIDELKPVIVIESDRPEWMWPGGTILWQTFGSLAAVAAEVAHFVLWNPPGSGVLGVITGFRSNGTQGTARWFWTVTDPATNAGFAAGNVALRDARAYTMPGFVSGIALRFYLGTLTAAEIAAYAISTAALPQSGAGFVPHDERVIIVPEGFGWGYTRTDVNVAEDVEIIGYQHVQERGELS